MRRNNRKAILAKLKQLKATRVVRQTKPTVKKPTSPVRLIANPKPIRPFILTCDKRLDTLRKFVASYVKIKHCLEQPVLIIDDSNEETRQEYHELLLELDPYATIAQPRYFEDDYKNIQHIMIKDFPNWALQFSDDNILFIEDDIEFSALFPSAIKKANQYMQDKSDFITFYSRSGYKPVKHYPAYSFMHPFNGDDYFGNICVLFARKVIKDLAVNWKKLLSYPEGWDIGWGRYMQSKRYRLYETKVCHANHLVGKSAFTGQAKAEFNEKF